MGLRESAGRGSGHGGQLDAARTGWSHGVEGPARAVFLGSDTFSLPILDALLRHGPGLDVPVTVAGVVTRPDRAAGRGRKVGFGPVKLRALETGLPVLQPDRAREPAAVEAILTLRPDVLVVASYGEILPRALLEAPRRKSVNLHPSLLPRYRGSSPIETAILNGDEVTGTTLMLMTAKMDAGPIIDQERVPIEADDTSASLAARLAELSAEMLLRDIPTWLSGSIEPVPQDESEATYTRRITKEDGRIEWTQPAVHIERQIRAYNPWPAAFTHWEGRQLRVVRARAEGGTLAPAIVQRTQQGKVVVGTGEGLLVLEEVQLAGGRPVTPQALIQGHRDFVGSRLEA